MKRRIFLAAVLALIAVPAIAVVAIPALRAVGLQLSKTSTNPGQSGQPTLWADTSTPARLRFDDGTNSNVVAAIVPSAKGDIAVYDGSAWQKIAACTNGEGLAYDSGQPVGVACSAFDIANYITPFTTDPGGPILENSVWYNQTSHYFRFSPTLSTGIEGNGLLLSTGVTFNRTGSQHLISVSTATGTNAGDSLKVISGAGASGHAGGTLLLLGADGTGGANGANVNVNGGAGTTYGTLNLGTGGGPVNIGGGPTGAANINIQASDNGSGTYGVLWLQPVNGNGGFGSGGTGQQFSFALANSYTFSDTGLDMGGVFIDNLSDPTTSSQAATKNYVDNRAAEFHLAAYNSANLAATKIINVWKVSGASTIADASTTNNIIGSDGGGGNFVTKVCSDSTTCGAGNLYVTCTFGCNTAVGTNTACTINKAAVAASTTLTLSVSTACGTTDPGANTDIHLTRP